LFETIKEFVARDTLAQMFDGHPNFGSIQQAGGRSFVVVPRVKGQRIAPRSLKLKKFGKLGSGLCTIVAWRRKQQCGDG